MDSRHVDLKVKVIPRAGESKIVGFQGEVLKVKVTAPARGGKANRALVELLSRALETKKGNIQILRGLKSREKLVRVLGLDPEVLNNLPRSPAK